MTILIKNKHTLQIDDFVFKCCIGKSGLTKNKVEGDKKTPIGIYKLGKKINRNNFFIKDVIEKPTIKKAPSNKAVIGRYILPRSIFSKLKITKPSEGGEIHITDAIQALINDNEKFIAHNFQGKYLDCGTMKGYINSSLMINKL